MNPSFLTSQKDFLSKLPTKPLKLLRRFLSKQRSSSLGQPYQTPIFIFGMMGRTGTNFLSRLLDNHPQCVPCYIYEAYLFEHIQQLKTYTQETQKQWRSVMPKEKVPSSPEIFHACLGRGLVDYLYQLTQSKGTPFSDAQRLIIKTPSVEHIDDFFEFFPNAPMILLIRDGRAVVESQARSFDIDRESLMHRWATAAEQVIQFTMKSDSQRCPYLVVKYETLHTHTASEISKILDFANLDRSSYNFHTALNLPITGSSTFGRAQGEAFAWKTLSKTGDFDPLNRAAHWTSTDNEKFDRIAGKYMRHFGYA